MNYFIIGGDKKEYGPANTEQVRQWVREGRANGETLLRAEGETDWKPLRAFEEFQADMAPAAPLIGEPVALPTGDLADEVPDDAPADIGHSFARAWHLVGNHFGTIFGACLFAWMGLTALQFIPFVGPIIAIIFSGPLFGGLFLVFLKVIREGSASAADIFVLSRENALSLILTGIVGAILTQIAMSCCCVVPGIYLQIAWLFGIPLVADRGLNFWQGLETSRRVITPRWFKFLGLFILAFLPVFVFHIYMTWRMGMDVMPIIQKVIEAVSSGGVMNQQALMLEINKTLGGYSGWILVKQLLLLVSMPLGIGSFAFVYEDLFGRKR